MSKNTKKKNNWSIYHKPYNNNFRKPEKNIVNIKKETIFEEFFNNDEEYNLNDLFKKVKIDEDKIENYYIRFHDLECEGTGGFFQL